MQRFTIGDLELEVDRERTAKLYTRMLDWCQCEFCTNAHITRFRHTPVEQIEWLRSLGVDPWRPCLSEASSRREPVLPHHVRRTSCWFVYGRILGPIPGPPVRFDRWNRLWADTSRAALKAWDSGLNDLNDDPDLIYVFASNGLPWLPGEVTEFRSESGTPCEGCGARYRETGYLKRRSLIPQWEGLPRLRHVLLMRDSRVYVEFCDSCGRMEHRIVPRQRPFRRTLKRARRETKALRRRWRLLGLQEPDESTSPPT